MLRRVADLIGIPFKDKGRDPSGMDCYGVAQAAMLRFGIAAPDFDVSCFDHKAINSIYEREKWSWEKVDDPEPGDLCAMRLDPDNPKDVSHVGIYVGDGWIIHTMRGVESHLVKIDHPYYSHKIAAWYRWNG